MSLWVIIGGFIDIIFVLRRNGYVPNTYARFFSRNEQGFENPR